ncbi:integrin alpha-9-like isoform X3 [Galleria mellonella]|uniref:Integrin alpha-9-like isoform X3 n=1 Tax=Galleria mellonella TaxID=7137 RepID=A0A6J3C650_GALME|nr:integrin alpha-9-like isoform X3 [Galleria mellonella]
MPEQKCAVYLAVGFQIIDIAVCIYFHESSYITLTARGNISEGSDFGYSMGYQQDTVNLVIGSPNSDRYGKVYSCSLKDPFVSNVTYCNEIDMNFEKMTPDTKTEMNPDQKFMLGASIAATTDYFLASAPLWTGMLLKINAREPDYYVYGTCLIHQNNGTINRYKGLYEQAQIDIGLRETQSIAGGVGWKTYVDEVHKLILISKTSTPPFKGTVLHLNIDKPLQETKKLSSVDFRDIIKLNLRYFGTSITAGNFFESSHQIYALSTRSTNMYGMVLFLRYIAKKNQLHIMKRHRKFLKIEDTTVGTMFGAALSGADLNNDGLVELLVGAPAQSEDRSVSDTGALHIYLGGSQDTVENLDRKRTIVSNKDGSRFGSTIAVNDLDGDDKPEIFVSAPYENFGIGALYIISGSEIYNNLIKHDGFKQISLSKLNLTQRIQNDQFKYFGYSIQVLPDLDNNGCDEIVVGAPNSQNAMLLRCIPRIHVNITSELFGVKIVREQDNNFTVTVCVNVIYFSKMEHINGILLVSNNIIGGEASISDIRQRMYPIDLSEKKPQYCEKVFVKLNNNEQENYRFLAKVNFNDTTIVNTKEFDKQWVTVSPDSKLEANVLEIFRHCTGYDCLPQLSMSMTWSGRNETYVVKSAQTESITVKVHNWGHSSYKACVWVHLTGAHVAQIDCANHNGGYMCYLPNPLKRNADYAFNITLDMGKVTNMNKHINVNARLYEDCPETVDVNGNVSSYKTENKSILLSLDINEILLNGFERNVTITDKEILDKGNESFNVVHEYLIVNKGVVTWKNIEAIIIVNKESYINISGFRAVVINKYVGQASSTDSNSCIRTGLEDGIVKCLLNLMPRSNVSLMATIPIFNNKIVEGLVDNTLRISSNMSLYLYPTATIMDQGSATTVIFQKELSLAQDLTVIILCAIILAVIILIVIAFILYKIGFFRRKQKEELKEHIRRKSFRQSTSSRHDNEPEEPIDLTMEVEDDAFVSSSKHLDTADDVPLQENEEKAEAEVHS